MEKFITQLLSSEKGQKNAQSMLFNASIIMYMFAAYLFTEKEYVLAICTVVVGWGMVEIRELAKQYIEVIKKNDGSPKDTK